MSYKKSCFTTEKINKIIYYFSFSLKSNALVASSRIIKFRLDNIVLAIVLALAATKIGSLSPISELYPLYFIINHEFPLLLKHCNIVNICIRSERQYFLLLSRKKQMVLEAQFLFEF